MKLSRTERWIISNQLQLLALLDPEQREYYEQSQKILENGYEGLYEDCINYIYPDDETFSIEKSRLVIDILDMFRSINNTLSRLEETDGLDIDSLKFSGFDGNEEADYMLFAKFFCTEFDGGRFSELVEGLNSFNTHWPVLESYIRMLEAWNSCPNKHKLTKDDLFQIQQAARYP
ncbi:YfbU family protein [bacterium]|nr:YfbU family protein [bacterium]